MKINYTSPLLVARGVFILVGVLCGYLFAGLFGALIGAVAMIMMVTLECWRKVLSLRLLLRILLGLGIGALFGTIIRLVPVEQMIVQQGGDELCSALWQSAVYVIACYLGVVVVLRTDRETLAVSIPYVRFQQKGDDGPLVLLDASAIMDQRLVMLLESGLLYGRLLVPKFVLDEIKVMADSPSSGKREKGERALDTLMQLREHKELKLSIFANDGTKSEDAMDMRIIAASQAAGARLVTNDVSLSKAARVEGVSALNIEEVAQSFKQKINVGEKIRLTITRPGKEEHQGVGYLSDGSMIVVNQASQYMGTTRTVVVISKLQTSSGVMVFAELEEQ